MRVSKREFRAFIIGASITLSLVLGIYTYAANLMSGSDVSYDNTGTSITSNNVNGALTELYEMVDSHCPSGYTCKEKKACDYNIGDTWNYAYSGSVQEFEAPCNGTYQIELWGASGSNGSFNGAYTAGEIELDGSTKLYVYVGEKGRSCSNYSQCAGVAFNGGGEGGRFTLAAYPVRSGGGGGATDVRLVGGSWDNFDSLKSRIMVAAGGGTCSSSEKCAGGGLTGYTDTAAYQYGTAGTQTTGGTTTGSATAGKFGQGGNGYITYPNEPNCNSAFAGGSGYYGGAGGQGGPQGCSPDHIGAGAGGSSFISGHTGCNAIKESSTSTNIIHTGQSIHYSGYKFTDTVMIDGAGYNWTNTKGSKVTYPYYNGNSASNGYAKITLISY